MTNTTNAATAHSTCSHPKTKVARARCRKARYLATSRPAPTTYYVTLQAKGSNVTHHSYDFEIGPSQFACTNKYAKSDAVRTTHDTLPSVTCKNCTKNVTPTAYQA